MNTTPHKKILFMNSHAPFGSSQGYESQEMLLMASAFNKEISVIFIDDGVLQLKNQQHPETLDLKNYPLAYKALPMYDIHQIYVVSESLRERGLKEDDLILAVKIIKLADIHDILQTQDFIFNF